VPVRHQYGEGGNPRAERWASPAVSPSQACHYHDRARLHALALGADEGVVPSQEVVIQAGERLKRFGRADDQMSGRFRIGRVASVIPGFEAGKNRLKDRIVRAGNSTER
jgi:hypothetical protein